MKAEAEIGMPIGLNIVTKFVCRGYKMAVISVLKIGSDNIQSRSRSLSLDGSWSGIWDKSRSMCSAGSRYRSGCRFVGWSVSMSRSSIKSRSTCRNRSESKDWSV